MSYRREKEVFSKFDGMRGLFWGVVAWYLDVGSCAFEVDLGFIVMGACDLSVWGIRGVL